MDQQGIVNEHTRIKIERVECNIAEPKATCQSNYKYQVESINVE